MQAESAHRGMKIGLNRGRATTRVAPTTGLPWPIFVPMTGSGWVGIGLYNDRVGPQTRPYRVIASLPFNTTSFNLPRPVPLNSP